MSSAGGCSRCRWGGTASATPSRGWRGGCRHPVPSVPPSTLLQNLESCASDPVAVAVCFVTRVSAGMVGDPGGGPQGCAGLSPRSPCPQSQEFAIYTQYCNNYPR